MKTLLTREDLQKIKLPLSDEDYMRLHGAEAAGQLNWTDEFPELSDAFDKLEVKYFDQTYPNSGVGIDDVIWVLPPWVTKETVDQIKDPLAKEVALKALGVWNASMI